MGLGGFEWVWDSVGLHISSKTKQNAKLNQNINKSGNICYAKDKEKR